MNYQLKKIVLIICLLLIVMSCNKKNEIKKDTSFTPILNVDQIKPPHWWVGFESNELQILLKSDQIQNMDVTIDYPGVKVLKVNNADSPNYLFIDIEIDKKYISRLH